VVKYDLLKAEPSHLIRELYIFDIAGVSRYADRDMSAGLLGPGFLARNRACYDPRFHDPFEWGPCRDYGARFAVLATTGEGRAAMRYAWAKAIAVHPVAYLEHRITYFDRLTRTLCGTCENRMTWGVSWLRPWREGLTERVVPAGVFWERLAFALYDGPTGRGLPWMVLLAGCLVVLAVLHRRRAPSPAALLAFGLALSGLGYALALFVIGIAYPLRYLHWTIMLAGMALPLVVSVVAERRREARG
jgi:hypothetical protein